jgi:hypothetical protein
MKRIEEVKTKVQEIDVWIEPFPSQNQNNLPLGLLGKMVTTQCLFDPFCNPPSEVKLLTSFINSLA